VEVMMVVLIVSLLGAIAVPGFAAVQRRARTAAVVNDLRVFAAAFQAYAQVNGSWPEEVGAGVIPPGMSDRISAGSWTRPTPVGGKYNWENDTKRRGVRYRAAIAISATKDAPLLLDIAQLEDIDRAIDDGNLNTGIFQTGVRSNPLFIIEP
jgi:type II secretory pathway pseudopilin PulG